LIFVAFFVPLAIYLLILGYVNRRPRPLVVSGTLDFIGVLFAASGFLVCGGPALLSSLNERWRLFWLLGDTDSLLRAPGWHFGALLSLLYFVAVVAGCAMLLARQRRLTSIYNVEPAAVEAALAESCAKLGLDPIRSGNLFVFGLSLGGAVGRPSSPEGIQAPHYLTQRPAPPLTIGNLPGGDDLVGQNAILEVEAFAATRHVTLQWDPHDSPLRPALEAELERRLRVVDAPYHDTGLWLILGAFGLMALSVLILLMLLLRAVVAR
jgi:hypothetical protein